MAGPVGRSARTGDPLNPMDPTAGVRMSSFVQDQEFSGVWMLKVVSPFAGFHMVCILQVHTPVDGRLDSLAEKVSA